MLFRSVHDVSFNRWNDFNDARMSGISAKSLMKYIELYTLSSKMAEFKLRMILSRL